MITKLNYHQKDVTTATTTTTMKSPAVTTSVKQQQQRNNHNNNYNNQHVMEHYHQHRCFVCFKLVKNLKGNKLCHYYDLNSTITINGEQRITENNVNNNTNLVNKKSGEFVKFKQQQQQQAQETTTTSTSTTSLNNNNNNKLTVGESILKTLRDLKKSHMFKPKQEMLLNDNLIYMKKICENCFTQMNSIDYHLKNAFKHFEFMTFKLKKSNRLIKSFEKRSISLRVNKKLNGFNSYNNTNNNINNKFIKRKLNDTDLSTETNNNKNGSKIIKTNGYGLMNYNHHQNLNKKTGSNVSSSSSGSNINSAGGGVTSSNFAIGSNVNTSYSMKPQKVSNYII
jgi:hypothetical protein